jgi:hypothetical protein
MDGYEVDDLQRAHRRRQPELRYLADSLVEEGTTDRGRHRNVTFFEFESIAEDEMVRLPSTGALIFHDHL